MQPGLTSALSPSIRGEGRGSWRTWIYSVYVEKYRLITGGFLYVEDILKHKHFKKYKIQDVEEVVANNEKQRFSIRLCPVTNKLQIRANQGHSLQVCKCLSDVSIKTHCMPYLKKGKCCNPIRFFFRLKI